MKQILSIAFMLIAFTQAIAQTTPNPSGRKRLLPEYKISEQGDTLILTKVPLPNRDNADGSIYTAYPFEYRYVEKHPKSIPVDSSKVQRAKKPETTSHK